MPTVPYTFTAHTLIESAKVNANFAIFDQVLGLTGGTLTGTLTTRALVPSANDTYDLGLTGTRYRDAWFSRNAAVGGTLGVTGATTLATLTSGAITASGSSTIGGVGLSGGVVTGSGAALTSIPETAITDGSLLARLADAETVTGLWSFQAGIGGVEVSGTSPHIRFHESDAGLNLKDWTLIADAGVMAIRSYQDGFGASSVVFQIDKATGTVLLPFTLQVNGATSTGNLTVTNTVNAGGGGTLFFQAGTAAVSSSGAFTERSRAFAMGATQTPAFSAGDYTCSGAMTWTVDSGDVAGRNYSLIGDTMSFRTSITASVLGGVAANAVRITIPGGFTAAETYSVGVIVDQGGTLFQGIANVVSGLTYISVTFHNGAAFTLGTFGVYIGTLDFKVS